MHITELRQRSTRVTKALVEAFLWLVEHDFAYIDIHSPTVLVPRSGNGQVVERFNLNDARARTAEFSFTLTVIFPLMPLT